MRKEIIVYECDNCGKVLQFDKNTIGVNFHTISQGWHILMPLSKLGSKHEQYFCSEHCVREYLQEKRKK